MRELKFARFLALPKQCKARAVVADRFCKQPLANTGAYDEISPPAHGVFKPKRDKYAD